MPSKPTTIKKPIHGKRLDELLDAIHQKNPDGLLAIQCKFETSLHGLEFKCLLKDICSGKVSSKAVIKETLLSIKIFTKYAEKDAINIRKCAAFINRKYPHAIFSGENFTIGVNNLTPTEIDDCLAQKELRFTYFNDMNP